MQKIICSEIKAWKSASNSQSLQTLKTFSSINFTEIVCLKNPNPNIFSKTNIQRLQRENQKAGR